MQRNAAWAIAIALGAAGLGLQLAPAALAPAASCPGLLDRAAIVATQIARDAPLGAWLLRADRLIFFLAVVLFGRAAIAASGSWLAASAVTLAFAASPLFAPSMSPLDPAVAAVASLAAVFVLREPRGSRWMPWGVGLCVAAIALSIPPVMLPGWVVPPLPAAFGSSAPAVSCMWPSAGTGGAGAALSSVGTYCLVLGVFGLFTIRAKLLDRRALLPMALAVAAILVASAPGASASRALAPAVAMLWLAASVGLAEVARAAGPRAGGRVAAVILAALVPIVPLAVRYDPTRLSPMAAGSLGHDRITLDGMRRLIQLLPDKSVLVEEDATLDLLLRASSGTWQRSGKELRVVSAEPAAVAAPAGDAAWHVFALPVAQTNLPLLGFVISEKSLPGVSGVSLVEKSRPCSDVGEAWEPIDFAPDAPMLVLRSTHPHEDGAVAAWLGSAHPMGLTPVGWPAWVAPGFLPSAYGAGDRERAREDAVADGLSGHEAVFGQATLIRLEIWKVPGAPRLLPFALGADGPAMGLIHATPGVTLQLCPGYPHAVHPIALPQ